MGDQSAAHSALVNACLLYLGQRDDILVCKRHVGLFRRVKGDPQVYKIGTDGEADIQGVWLRLARKHVRAMNPPTIIVGQAFAIECKTGNARLNTDQKNWRDKFESVGGLYVVARDVTDLYKVWPVRAV